MDVVILPLSVDEELVVSIEVECNRSDRGYSVTPIAIVGRSGLFPNSPTLEHFWEDRCVRERSSAAADGDSSRSL